MVTTAEDSASGHRDDPTRDLPPTGESGWARVTPRQRDLLALAILAVILLIPVRGLLRLPGPQMEEGFMLVFPERLLKGDIPNRDFLHLYGPGSLWALAGVYRIFGAELVVERLFGLLQQAGVMFGVFLIARWWGRRVAVVCALLAMVLMLPPAGLTAFAWTGGVALGLIGIGLGLHARAHPIDRTGRVFAVLAGVAIGSAFLFRLDLVVALALALAVIVWRAPRSRVVPLIVSAAATASIVLVQFAVAGFANAFRGMVLEPVFDLRAGRRLPVPPSWGEIDGFLQGVGEGPKRIFWPLPALASSNQLFLWFFGNLVAIAVLVAVGIWAVRRDRTSIRARAVLASGVFSLGMVSQTLQRPDSTHIAWVSCVSIGLVPIALMEILDAWRVSHPTGFRGMAARHRRLTACAVPALLLVLLVPNFTVRTYGDFTAQTFDRRRNSFLIGRDGRIFYYGSPSVAAAANAMIADLDRIVRPGDRLFVGPADLAKTVTSEAWIYHLFPETTPGTYFIEMDPGVANAKGSRLADDLRSSDVVVLSRVYHEWAEANDSVVSGDPTPNRILRKRFCSVGTYDPWFEVFERCDRQPAPPEPAQ